MGKKIGFTCSTFDLLHAGHVMMLRDAKQQCDYLICGIQVDPSTDRPEKNAPIQTIVERYTQLKAVGYVDEIIPYGNEEDLEDILTLYNNKYETNPRKVIKKTNNENIIKRIRNG